LPPHEPLLGGAVVVQTRAARPHEGGDTSLVSRVRQTPEPDGRGGNQVTPCNDAPLTFVHAFTVSGWIAAIVAHDVCGWRSTLKEDGQLSPLGAVHGEQLHAAGPAVGSAVPAKSSAP
jgi:hypothetical protein